MNPKRKTTKATNFQVCGCPPSTDKVGYVQVSGPLPSGRITYYGGASTDLDLHRRVRKLELFAIIMLLAWALNLALMMARN
jgi:hypothetical protein